MRKMAITLGAAMALAPSLIAKTVSPDQALKAAQHHMETYSSAQNAIGLTLIETYYTANAVPTMYLFVNETSGGFVLVSAEDRARPILGYSTKGKFDVSKSAPQVRSWMSRYSDQIGRIAGSPVTASSEIAHKWAVLAEGAERPRTAARGTAIAPLITTEWEQGGDYSAQTPGTSPTGSVATAMAQIMKYWDHPTTGTGSVSYNTSTLGGTLTADFGSTTYDWANMPNRLTPTSSAQEIEAVSKLMFHCGVSTETNYEQQASYANVASYGGGYPSAELAFPGHFGYKSSITLLDRDDFTDQQWTDMLMYEIDQSRPVLYSSYGEEDSHAFIFDGYDDNGYFHVNWGWGGNSDGYYLIDDLDPPIVGTGSMGGPYEYGHMALIMIEPQGSNLPANPFQADYNVVLNAVGLFQPSASEIYRGDPYQIDADIINAGPDNLRNGFVGTMAFDLINGGGHLTINGNGINMNVEEVRGFQLPYIAPLPVGEYVMLVVYFKNIDRPVLRLVGEDLNENAAYLLVKEPLGIARLDRTSGINMYPNPSTGKVTLDLSGFGGHAKALFVNDITGKCLHKSYNLGEGKNDIDLSTLPNGTYFMLLNTDQGAWVQKIVIRK